MHICAHFHVLFFCNIHFSVIESLKLAGFFFFLYFITVSHLCSIHNEVNRSIICIQFSETFVSENAQSNTAFTEFVSAISRLKDSLCFKNKIFV